jgi:class 3 adenylate cyclase
VTAREFHYAWEWRLAATPSALWPLVSDTNRFNRDAGVGVVEERAGVTPGTRRLRLRRYGVLVEWDEEPFEWVKPRSFGVLRRYAAGPVSEMRVFTRIEPDGADHSRMLYEVTATPRNAIGHAAIPFEIGLLSAHRFRAIFERYAREAVSTPDQGLPDYAQQRLDMLSAPARLAAGGRERIERVRANLATRFDSKLIDLLIDAVVRAEPLCAARLRPYLLADVWGVRRREVVDLCLHATRAGLLDLQWDVLCPMCRGAKQTNDTLRGLSQPVHCESCNIDFFANFEQQVELTFKPNEAIRAIEVFPFCVGGPQLTPHIVAQQVVPAHELHNVGIELEAGQYRIRSAGVAGGRLFRVDTPGEQIIALENASDERRLMLVERMAWTDQALTAAEVIALQEFRDLFSAEALRPGEAINVGNMAILFTDLVDSTRMYRQIGDAPAFGRVMDHFAVLRTAMQEEEGALVKTIGDAVMAVFRRPAGAIRTVLRAQHLLATLPEGVRPPNLKAGIHFGPCIAVTLNDRLDYFGSTVNIAARLDGLSKGGEIVISEAVADDPEVQSLLREPHVNCAPFEAQLKGYEDSSVRLLRVSTLEKG